MIDVWITRVLFYNPMERHQSESNASKQYFKIVKPNEFTVISEKFLSKGSCDLKRFDIMTGRYDNDNVEGDVSFGGNGK